MAPGTTEAGLRWGRGVHGVVSLFSALTLALTLPTWAESPGSTSERLDALILSARQARHALDFRSAEATLEQVLEETRLEQTRSEDLVVHRAHALIELGTVRGHGGAMALGEISVREAIALLEPLDEPETLGMAYRRLAEMLNAQGQHGAADDALEAAATLYRRLGDRHRLANLEVARSTLAVHRGDYATTRAAAWRALDVLSGGPALSALANLAYAEHQLGDLDAAERRYGEVLRLAWQVGDQYALDFAFCNRAEVRWQRGESEPALADLERAVEGFEKARARIAGSPEERTAFLGRQVAAYDRLVRYRANTGDAVGAFEAAERFHGRSFLDRLDPRARDLARQPQPDLRAAERAILDRLAELHRPMVPVVGARGRQADVEVGELEGALRRIEGQWWRRDPRRAAWVAPRPPDLEEVQATLRPDEALVAFWLAEDQTLSWVVTSTDFRQVRSPVGRDALERRLADFLHPLRDAGTAEDLALMDAEADHLETARWLHQTLIEPLPDLARRAERWILVPDGPLHELPFGALVAGCEEVERPASDPGSATPEPWHRAYAGCRYLGLEKALSRVPSAGALRALRHRKVGDEVGSGELLALAPAFEGPGPPARLRAWGALEHNREEARRVARWFDDAQVFEGAAASEARLLAEVGRYRRIHLATHGWVDDAHPLGSGLVLATDDGGEGLLQMAEILRLEIDAELVTLSACRSGRGALSRSEGVHGLGQAFLLAGASALVLALWDVDDPATPHLMDAFYRHLSEGAAPAVALRDARRVLASLEGRRRLAFRERTILYAHPRFWSGFVVVGDG